jgi:probable sporulation protein (polysaccharide deacetylase family)
MVIRMKLLLATVLFVVVLFGIGRTDGIETFVEEVKQHTGYVVISDPYQVALPSAATTEMMSDQLQGDREKLRERIQQEADNRRVKPIDARLDKVWKAIPALNGIEVDIEKTMALAIQHPYAEPLPLVLKEVPPAIELKDLGAQPIYKGNPEKPMVALMINVAWGNEYLPHMLEVLKKEQVKATFFLDGSWLKKNADMAKTILEAGHELSNHAYSHKDMSKLGREQATAEISKTEVLLKELGVVNKLFAPPSGDFGAETVRIAHELGLHTILWTLDTIDWMKPAPATIVNKVRTRVEPGTLILMHPTASSSEALEQMIAVIKDKKLLLGTVSEVISPHRVPQVELK